MDDLIKMIKIPMIENVCLLDGDLRVVCKGVLMTNPHELSYVSEKSNIKGNWSFIFEYF